MYFERCEKIIQILQYMHSHPVKVFPEPFRRFSAVRPEDPRDGLKRSSRSIDRKRN